VLKWLCGNPLSRFLPVVETKTIVKKRPPIKVARSLEVLVTPAEQNDVILPSEAAGLVVPAIGGSGPAGIFSSFSPFNALYLLPAALLFSNTGGHSSPPLTPNIPPTVVPEPAGAAYVLMVMPIVALAAVRRRKARGTTPSESTS
jgi:hypothetical protein